jgi:Fe-S cluster assembly scaffold protein SufB
MEHVREQASQLLEVYFTPPQRYGTAFLLRPPQLDVRLLALPAGGGLTQLDEWEHIPEAAQQFFFSSSVSDPYYLWHVAHLPQVETQLLRIPAGSSQELQTRIFSAEDTISQVYWIVIEAGASLTWIDDVACSPLALRHVYVWQEDHSAFTYTGLRAGNQFLHERFQVKLHGSKATTDITHLGVSAAQEQADIDIKVWHAGKQCESNLTARCVVGDKATFMYRGLIDIAREASGSVGYQSGKALLRSRQAVVDMLPHLEIRTNDVRCSHGVTTTHLDDEALFYLRSRGLPYAQAEALATRGFFHDRLAIPAPLTQRLEDIL